MAPTYRVPHPDSSPGERIRFFRPVQYLERKEEVECSREVDGVKVILHNADTWKKLAEIGNEMMLSSTGRYVCIRAARQTACHIHSPSQKDYVSSLYNKYRDSDRVFLLVSIKVK